MMTKASEKAFWRAMNVAASCAELEIQVDSVEQSIESVTEILEKLKLQRMLKTAKEELELKKQDRSIALFSNIGPDGALIKSTLRLEIDRIGRSMYSDATAELFELNFGRAIRRFALHNLLPHQRGRFLSLAGVPVQEAPYEAEIARLTSAEAYDALYADDFDREMYSKKFSELFEMQKHAEMPRIPAIDEWLFDHEISVGIPNTPKQN